MGIALDAMGGAYVTGYTSSTDLPILNPFQSSYGGDLCDAYVFKLDPTGKVLLLSTYFGGMDTDAAYDIALDPNGNVYLCGGTYSTDFPTFNAFQPGNSGDCDGFILKFDLKGSATLYSTYAGGSDRGARREPSPSMPTATSTSLDKPIPPTSPSHQARSNRTMRARRTCSSSSSTRPGTPSSTPPMSVAAGMTKASTSPSTAAATPTSRATPIPRTSPPPALSRRPTGDSMTLSPSNSILAGNALVYSTYVGGGDTDFALGIAIDDAGNAYITGGTYSLEFPTASPLIGTTQEVATSSS